MFQLGRLGSAGPARGPLELHREPTCGSAAKSSTSTRLFPSVLSSLTPSLAYPSSSVLLLWSVVATFTVDADE